MHFPKSFLAPGRSIERSTKGTENLPFKIIFWMTLYLPFEEFFLRWLPSPIAVILRFVPELILYGLAIKVCGTKIWHHQPLKKTPIDLLVVVFFVATAISIVINDASIKGSLVNLRTIWRYLSVFYITVNIEISISELKRLLDGFKAVMLAQAVIGSIQYFLPASFNQAFFAPREFQVGNYQGGSHAAKGSLKVGATAGTFSDSAILSAFLLIGFALLVARVFDIGNGTLIPNWIQLRDSGLVLFSLFSTKKRAALLIGLLVPLITLYVYRKTRSIANVSWFYGAAAVLGLFIISAIGAASSAYSGVDAREESVDLGSYFLQLFSPDYWEQSNEAARGWFTTTILNAVFSTHSWFGFGPDAWHTIQSIKGTLTTGADIDKIERDAGVFDDSFWFAFLAYFGVIGTAVYGLILKRLYDAGRWLARVSSEPEYRILGATFGTLVVITVLYTFVERTFRLRAFSFYFWLLAGLVVNICHIKIAEIKQASPQKTIQG